jgi:uncharacterized membrane protein YfcA
MPYFELWHLPVVFIAGLVGEGYATIVGSGGVLIQFVLASLGVPLAVVVATDIGGSQGADLGIIAASSRDIWRNKKVLALLAAPSLLGGIIGTVFLIHIPVIVLKVVLITGLALLLVYVLIGKKAELQTFESIHMNMRRYPVVFLVMFALGVYANVSGVGSGTFSKFAFLSLLRVSFVDSLGITGIVALPAGIFSIIATGMSGLIAWPYFIMIFIGSFIGANFVARHVSKVPEKYLRALLLVIISLYLVYLVSSII